MSDAEKDANEEAVARVIVEAIKAAHALYPDASTEAIEAMAMTLMLRGFVVLRGPRAS